jgi:hypothetical protein
MTENPLSTRERRHEQWIVLVQSFSHRLERLIATPILAIVSIDRCAAVQHWD